MANDPGAFRDDDTNRFEPFIEAASDAGLIRGCNPPDNDHFCPNDVVTRAEMAMMLARAIDLPQVAQRRFDDVSGHPAASAIERLAEAGITSGCESSRFCPDHPVTRGQLAALLARAFGREFSPVGYSHFRDLDATPFASELSLLGVRGVLEACDPPVGRRICPDLAVTRGEAAHSLVTALGLAPVSPPGRLAAMEATPALAGAFDLVEIWKSRGPTSRNRLAVTPGFWDDGLGVTIPKGAHYGADLRLDLSSVVGHEPEQLFFRYYLRFDPDWAPRASGKLPGFSGVYGRAGKGGHRSSPASPGWSARMQFFGARPEDTRARLGFYVYHLGQERRYGDGMMWNEAGKLQLDEWYCVEGEVRLNTPGLSDGALRAWVDGTPAFDSAGIQFRRSDEPGIRIESFWFNVYYGGKAVASSSLGLTVDGLAVDTARIGCGAGDGLGGSIEADVMGDGLPGRVWWGECPGGTCFQLARTTAEGVADTARLGDTAWFSLETHELGLRAADLTGNGHDDIFYRGRCGRSVPCWRVHRSAGSSVGPGEDWGDGLRLAQGTDALITGDFDGDGFDDVAYRGRCGSPSEVCWRVHRSLGNGFAEPEHWGSPPDEAGNFVEAADITHNALSDLVYTATCAFAEKCWFAQTSTGSSFSAPRLLGVARNQELEFSRLFDVDGDGRADLVTAHSTDDGATIVEFRPMTDRGWGRLTWLANGSGPFEDLLLRVRNRDLPVQALIVTGCDEETLCVDTRSITAGVAHHAWDLVGRSEAIQASLLGHRAD